MILFLAPEGRELAAVVHRPDHVSSQVLTWDVGHALAPLSYPTTLEKGIERVAYSPDGRYLAASTSAGRLIITDRTTGRVVWQRSLKSPFASLVFAPDGKRLATGSIEGIHTLRLETRETGIGFPMSPTRFAFSPDGRRVAGHATKGDIFVYEYDHDNDLVLRTIFSDLFSRPDPRQHPFA